MCFNQLLISPILLKNGIIKVYTEQYARAIINAFNLLEEIVPTNHKLYGIMYDLLEVVCKSTIV